MLANSGVGSILWVYLLFIYLLFINQSFLSATYTMTIGQLNIYSP